MARFLFSPRVVLGRRIRPLRTPIMRLRERMARQVTIRRTLRPVVRTVTITMRSHGIDSRP
jgi:hypothetical protein